MVWPDSSSVLHAERRVFLGQAAQRDAHLFLVGLGLGLDGLRDHRLGEHHPLERDDRIRIAQRLAGGHFLQAHAGGDVAGEDFLDLFALVGVHLQDPADALLLAADRVVDRVARLQHARVDAHEGQLADERVGHQLERQRGELLVVVGLARRPSLSSSSVPGTGGMSIGDGMKSMTASSMRCTPLFLKAVPHSIGWISPAIVRVRMPSLISASVSSPDFEVLVHQLFAGLGGGLDHLLAPLLRVGQQVGRDLAVVELHALRASSQMIAFILIEVDHAGEVLFGADRDHDRHRVGLQARPSSGRRP